MRKFKHADIVLILKACLQHLQAQLSQTFLLITSQHFIDQAPPPPTQCWIHLSIDSVRSYKQGIETALSVGKGLLKSYSGAAKQWELQLGTGPITSKLTLSSRTTLHSYHLTQNPTMQLSMPTRKQATRNICLIAHGNQSHSGVSLQS